VTQRTDGAGDRRNHGRVMIRRLSLPEHGALELLAGLALLAAPFVLGFGEGASISAHMTADALLAGALIGAGLALAASGDRMAGALLAAAAAGELALSLGTRWTRP
jgi:hypothetical protein